MNKTRIFLNIAVDLTDAYQTYNYLNAIKLHDENTTMITCVSPRDVNDAFKRYNVIGYYITPECAESDMIDSIIKIIENERNTEIG